MKKEFKLENVELPQNLFEKYLESKNTKVKVKILPDILPYELVKGIKKF